MRLQIRPLKTAVVVAGMIAALAVSAQTASAASQRALLIGIGKYKNINNLSGPPKDVARVEQFLIGNWHFKKDEIAVLLDEKATRKGILRSIEQWLINSSCSIIPAMAARCRIAMATRRMVSTKR